MLKIIPIPALTGTYDNYIWLLHNDRQAIVVDPGDAAPVLAYLQKHRLSLSAILITHRHNDHIRGIAELVKVYNNPVYGPRLENIAGVTQTLGEPDHVEIDALGLRFKVLDIPGHTLGHIAYLGHDMLFCGDTLFGCACGKMFEGTPTQFHASLQKLANLPDKTQVYCAHEYTESNVRFALLCEPDNAQLQQRQRDVRVLREHGKPTLPSDIALEKATNPFLRCNTPQIIASIAHHFELTSLPTNEIAVFAALRTWRDHF
ncbi:MAG: hydroxyacylglutathione hydrolase [Gallionellaceae bacterium]|jgi:hydroxyacylglutathione hydrolase